MELDDVPTQELVDHLIQRLELESAHDFVCPFRLERLARLIRYDWPIIGHVDPDNDLISPEVRLRPWDRREHQQTQ